MPTDLSLDVRRSIVAHLKSYAPLTGIVSAARIYGEESPANTEWPFIRYGLPIVDEFEATGWDGSEQEVTIHAFVNGPATDNVSRAARQVVEAMKSWAPVGLGVAAGEWLGTTILRDSPEAEGSKYHAVIRFNVAVTA